MTSEQKLSKEEFCARFKAHMLKHFEQFAGGKSVAEYADENAPIYFDGYLAGDAFNETPEDAADSDMSYWGED